MNARLEKPAADSSASPAASDRPAGYLWLVLAASLLVQTVASFGNQGLSPLAPFLVDDLGLSRGQVGLLVTAAYLGACFVLIPAGGLSDRFGVRTLFLAGMAATGAPLILTLAAPDFFWLLVPMLLYGLGNGVALPPTTRAIVEWFPARQRGLAMGIKQTGVALAGVLCGLVMPVLGSLLGWRGALAAAGLVIVAAGVLAWAVYRDRPVAPRAAGTRPPGLGTVLKSRPLLLLGLVTLLYGGIQLSTIGFLALFLRERAGLDPTAAGAWLALTQGGGVVGRVGWGVVSDTLFGGRRKVVLGLIGASACLALLALGTIGPETPALLLAGILVAVGASVVAWNGVNMTFVAEIAGPARAATAAGLNLTFSYLGVIVTPPLFGLLVDVTGSYTTAFQAGAGAYLVALLLLWQVHEPRLTSAAQ